MLEFLEFAFYGSLGELLDSLFLGNRHISRLRPMGIRWIYKYWWFHSFDGAFWVSDHFVLWLFVMCYVLKMMILQDFGNSADVSIKFPLLRTKHCLCRTCMCQFIYWSGHCHFFLRSPAFWRWALDRSRSNPRPGFPYFPPFLFRQRSHWFGWNLFHCPEFRIDWYKHLMSYTTLEQVIEQAFIVMSRSRLREKHIWMELSWPLFCIVHSASHHFL